MRLAIAILVFLATAAFGADPGLGLGPVPVNGGAAGTFSSVTDTGLTSGRVPYATTGGLLTDAGTLLYAPTTGLTADQLTSSGLTSGRITTAGAAGKLSDYAGLAIIGTPSATAPSAGTNGPGLTPGIVAASADGSGAVFTASSFGNSVAQTTALLGYTCQGTAAAPGATISGDNVAIQLRGHDGTAFVGNAGNINVMAGSTWSNTNHDCSINFATTPSGSTTRTAAFRIDNNQCLVSAGANSVGTFSAGTLRPHVQLGTTSAATAGMFQTIWINNTQGPTGGFAKSRGAAVGTQSVITTGDTLGTFTWQGDDGTNFIAASQIVGKATGTIATGQVPGTLNFLTANSAGTMTQAMQVDSAQVVIVGASTAAGSALFDGGTLTPQFQQTSNSSANGGSMLSTISYRNSATISPMVVLAKSRSSTIGTMTVCTTGDTLGTVNFEGTDGTNFVSAAKIITTCTGTLGSTQVPGNMAFQTGTNASPSVLTTAMTITNAQVVQENGTTEATAIGTANVVNSGGLSVAKRAFMGTIATTFSGNVEAGVEDGTAAAAGQVGEVLTGAQSTPTNFTTTGTIQNLASISLTRGDWLETATMTLAMNGATEVAAAEAVAYLDDTTASATGATEGETIGYVYEPASASSVHATVTIIYHENISAAKTKYLNGQATWTAGQPKFTCSMKAVRIR